ncbi:MAG: hypothetical protein II007_04185 [Gammaproteobacteria bacterium]|nr:hypothetical protein [Gammaproteobacteria bacterium]
MAALLALCQADGERELSLVTAYWSGVPQAALTPATLTRQLLTELVQTK